MANQIKHLGDLVREYRNKRDLSQAQLAELLGYDNPQFISLFECNHSKVPLEVLGQLIVILKIPQAVVRKHLISTYEKELEIKLAAGMKKALPKVSGN